MLVRKIHEIARSNPNRVAMICNDVKVTYLAFSNAIQLMAGFLKQKNLPPDRTAVVLDIDPSVQWVVVLGMRSLGLNTIAVSSLDQIDALGIKECACIVTPENYSTSPGDISKISPTAQFVAIPDNFFYNPPQDLLPNQESKHQFGGHILYTSGTTGVYKKLMIESKHEAERNLQRAKLLSFTQETVWQGSDFGLWTAAGFKNPSAVWSSGGCVVLDRRVDWYKHFLSHGVNAAFLTPLKLKELLKTTRSSSLPNSRLRLTVSGGFVSVGLAEDAIRKLTSNLLIHYGTTEVEGPFLRSTYKSASDLFWFEPLLENRVQVVDENGDECEVGQEGELRIVLSEIDSRSYMDDETASAKYFRNGFFYPGDLALRREDGFIKILGRSADVINIQGNKTAVAPIEQSIQSLLGVDEVCVFSGLSDKGVDVLIIAVESQEALSKSDLEIVGSKFSQFDKISVVIFKEFPRTQAGLNKVNRRALKKRIFGEMGRLGI